MRMWLLLVSFLVSFQASAQFSIVESDSGNRLRLLGRDFNMNFFSFAGLETDKMQNEGGRLTTYNYLTFATYLDDLRFSVRVPFQYNTAGSDRFNGKKVNAQETYLQDLILGLQKSDPLFLPWDLESYWEGRIYLPTSEQSQRTGMMARLRNTFNLAKVLTRNFELEYMNQASYYIQSRTAYLNRFEDQDGYLFEVISPTKQFDLDHKVTLWGKVSSATGLGLQFGQEISWWNASAQNQRDSRRQRELNLGPALKFPLSRNANFILSYADTVDQDANAQELGKFLAKNTQISLLSFLRF